jgi:hypothetical protein
MREAFEQGMQVGQNDMGDVEAVAPTSVEMKKHMERMEADEADIRAYLDTMITHDIASMSLEEIFGEDVLKNIIQEFGNKANIKESQVRNTWEHVTRHQHVAKGIQDALRLMSDVAFQLGKTDDPIEVQKTFLHDVLFVNPYTSGPLFSESEKGDMVQMHMSDALNKGFSRMLMRYDLDDTPQTHQLIQRMTTIIDSLYKPTDNSRATVAAE